MIFMCSDNVFDCPSSHSMAHCISGDTRMSKGVAVQFVREFPTLVKLRKGSKIVGTAAPVQVGDRFIYCLISKRKYYMKPTIADLHKCLSSMFNHAVRNRVINISMPRIGSGCDKLSFNADIMPLLRALFSDPTVNIYVYHYEAVPRYVLLRFKGRM